MSSTTLTRSRLVFGALTWICSALVSQGGAMTVSSTGCALSWGQGPMASSPELAIAEVERLVAPLRSSVETQRDGGDRVRIVAPHEFIARGGLSSLAFSRQPYRWALLAELDEGQVFWASLVPDRAGVTIRCGTWYSSRRTYVISRMRRLADRFLPEGWRSRESRLAEAFRRHGGSSRGGTWLMPLPWGTVDERRNHD